MAALRCSVRYFCFGAFLIFVGSVMMCAFGFNIVLPFMVTLNWPEVQCVTFNASLNLDHCSCNKKISVYDRCVARYPCLQVFVTVELSNRDVIDLSVLDPTSHVTYLQQQQQRSSSNSNTSNYNHEHGAPVNVHTPTHRPYSDAHTYSSYSEDAAKYTTKPLLLYRNWEDIYHQSCTLYECGAEEWNHKQVNLFTERLGKRHTNYTCFYNPENQTEVILERMAASSALHALLWPSICLLVGGLLWLGLCVGCWRIDNEQQAEAGAPPATGKNKK